MLFFQIGTFWFSSKNGFFSCFLDLLFTLIVGNFMQKPTLFEEIAIYAIA